MSAIDVIARALLLIVVAAGVTAVLRRTAASLRALVWTAALGGALALPLLLPLTPGWRIDIVRPDSAPPLPEQTQQSPTPGPEMPALNGQQAPHRPASEASSASAPISSTLHVLIPDEPVATMDWSFAAVIGSLAITLLLAARLAVGHARLRRLARTADVVDDPDWQSAVDEVRRHLALRGPIDVRASEGISIPAVAGVFRPTLLLPADARAWGADVRRAVLLHELAHVARRDALAQLVSQAACALYWFLPPVWLGARRAAALRERASDDVVLLAGVTPAGYAESLVRLARSASGADVPAAALAMARRSRLRERVIAILDPAIPRTAGSLVCALVVTAMAGLAAGVAAVEPAFVDAAAPDARDGVIVERAALPRLSVPPTPAAPPSNRPAPRLATAGAAQAAPQRASVICNDKVESSSTSISDDDNQRKWKVELTGNGCKLVLQAEGRIDFAPDFTDIAAISSGGFLRIDATNGGTRRQLEITPGNGGLRRSWRVDGREAAYDDAARAWFAAFLVELDRRTAIGVDVRLPHLLKQGGVEAVLDETALMPSDYARSRYYTQLARARTLSPAEVTRVLKQGASLTKSDYYAHQLIAAFAPSGVEDAAQREAVVGLIESMDSDYYRAESIQALLARGRPSATEMDLLLRVVTRMKSDHYKVQALSQVARAGSLTPAHQAMLLRGAAAVESDHYAAEFLKTLMRSGSLSASDRQSLQSALATIQSDHYAADVLTSLLRDGGGIDAATVLQFVPAIESDHYRADVLSTLLASADRSDSDLIGIVSAAASMSDHYESTVLRRVLSHRAANDRVRTAVLDAAARLSRHYGDEVRRAAGR